MTETGRIFIIDDEAAVREAFHAILLADRHEFAFATNGAEALTALGEQIPDVILLDVMMPNMDGYEVCRRIKADHRLRHVPVVLVTVLESKDDLVRGLDAGADEFLTKPVSAVELRARVRSMLRIKRQHDRLKGTLKMREDLANMIVHDMRAPLSVIVVHAASLAEAETAERADWKKRADAIRVQSERINTFLNDMLMLAKLEAGKLILARAAVDVSQLVRALEAEHRVVAESKGISLAVEHPTKGRYVMLDPTLLERVLDNLLSNAVKYSSRGGAVRVVVKYVDKRDTVAAGVRIEVHDQGAGIPDTEKERIFEQFQIVDQRQPGVTQIGLGLSFSKLAVEAHGGRISVTDNRPRGSIFVVEL
jgi:two-component system, sensor histidine kinase and response regulator